MQRLTGLLKQVRCYEDVQLQAQARACVPWEVKQNNTIHWTSQGSNMHCKKKKIPPLKNISIFFQYRSWRVMLLRLKTQPESPLPLPLVVGLSVEVGVVEEHVLRAKESGLAERHS